IKKHWEENFLNELDKHQNTDRIIDKGIIELLSNTSVRITNAKWVANRTERSFTGTLTIPAKPSSPNFREDIISYGNNPLPLVTSGAPCPDPVKPSPP